MGIEIPNPLNSTDHLWHYTDGTALLNIVERGILWATQIHYLNDLQELVHLAGEMAVATDLDSSATAENREFAEAIARALSRADLFRVCVLSFSARRDDLSQWRGYSTHGNGYAIGFEAGDVDRWVTDKKKSESEAGWTLNPVLYSGSVKDAVRHSLVNRGRRVRAENKGELPAFDQIDWASKNPFFGPALTSLITDVLAVGPMFKHESFEGEAEWRISTAPLPRENLRLRPRGTMMLPYTEVAFGPEVPVREIVVGPGPHAALNRAALEVAFGSSIKVTESSIPFRDW